MIGSLSWRSRVAALVVACGAAVPAVAAVHDAAADFVDGSLTGVWRYGWDSDATAAYDFTAFDRFSSDGTALVWSQSTYQVAGTPAFWKNTAGYSRYGVDNGQISLHPGPSAANASGDAAILRYVAAETGQHDIQASLLAGDSGTVLTWVVLNGDFTTPLAALGDTALGVSYSAALNLSAGDTLDFVVGNQGNHSADNTPISVVITTTPAAASVPEPASLALWAMGLGGLLAAGRRRRR